MPYRLEGLESEWIETDASDRRATYTTLPPGHYTFQVKAANPSGIWGEDDTPLTLTVLPPWWQTWWAYLAYLISAALFLALVVEFRTRSLKAREATLESQVSARTHELAEQKAIVEGQAKHLEELMETKDRLMTRISHEFRTPLTVILGPLDRLSAAMKDSEVATYLDSTKRNASRLLRLVNQMLGLARLRSEHYDSTRPVAIIPIARQVVASFESLAKERMLDLGLEFKEEVVVLSTEDAIEKIAVNLISNAIKYSPPGARICVSADKSEDTGTISVMDTGRGIESERLPHIFEPFERGHDEAERIPGSGLGLALVHELATAHGGKVDVESVPGRGSTFLVSLPLAEADASSSQAPGGLSEEAKLEVAALRSAQALIARPQHPTEPTHSLLVIEDNADMREYLKRLLGRLYRVDLPRTVTRGSSARSLTVPDLVVCDIMLPGKDGYAVCHALKTDDADLARPRGIAHGTRRSRRPHEGPGRACR